MKLVLDEKSSGLRANPGKRVDYFAIDNQITTAYEVEKALNNFKAGKRAKIDGKATKNLIWRVNSCGKNFI